MAQPTITLESATQVIDAGKRKAQELGLNAVFAVLDAGANLVSFERMDGAWLASNDLAVAKARTSVMFEMPSEALNAPVQLGEPLAHFDHTNGGLTAHGRRRAHYGRGREPPRGTGCLWRNTRAGRRDSSRCCELNSGRSISLALRRSVLCDWLCADSAKPIEA
jgi:hypothetical protein